MKKQGGFFLWPIKGKSRKKFFLSYDSKIDNYGVRFHPFTKEIKFYNYISIQIIENREIVSIYDGVITIKDFEVSIHNDNFQVIYSNIIPNSKLKSGQKVKKNQSIGFVGNNGHSIRLKLLYKNESINPIWFIW